MVNSTWYKTSLEGIAPSLEVGHIGRREGKRAQIENAMRGAGTVVTQPYVRHRSARSPAERGILRKKTTGGASWRFVFINFQWCLI